MTNIPESISLLSWRDLESSLSESGYAKTSPLLTQAECEALIRLYPHEERFRSHIDMARFRFGEGDYKYFAEPLPEIVQQLRAGFYPYLVRIANNWSAHLGNEQRFPESLDEFLAMCHKHGQRKPTPLILHYEAGAYNCLHQDLYGDLVFPLQLTCFLSAPGRDYTGGEFLLVEQRPRAQSKGEVISPMLGEIVMFATRDRPAQGTRGYYRIAMRHGVSRVHTGTRYTLGVIFHDAK